METQQTIYVAKNRAHRALQIKNWIIDRFGEEAMWSQPERTLRVVEETIELGQACGIDEEKMHRLVTHIYMKPAGRISQEAGGLMVCLAAWAIAHAIDLDQAEKNEVERILGKSTKHFQKRQNIKADAGLGIRVGDGAADGMGH